MKIVYIAHPVAGDIEHNIRRILKIITKINHTEPDVLPFAHYVVDVLAIGDGALGREHGMRNDEALIRSGIFSECRLYGNRISAGMLNEMKIFKEMGIPVRAMSIQTKQDFNKLLKK